MLEEADRRDDEESLIEYGSNRKRSRKKQTRTVPCPESGCSRMCRSQAELAIHRNSHTKDLKFKCKVPGCNKAFGTARSRNRHSENIKLHQQLFAQSYPASQIPLQFNSPPPSFSCYEPSFLPNYSTGYSHYPGMLTDCKPPPHLPPTSQHPPPTSLLYSDCKPHTTSTGLYSPVHGIPPHCV